ncbi:DUF3320 domain-containing protein [Xenorhabdus sp. XENO-10]|uniref:DUF3320 domain-containing protein n=1 Tax=Xenorhabdus yunnanensis TaxID=3025878 RepID=A0ABT5LIC5_9GAMM|nr:DUF3320 domain-containing protein [Xenorhabdus yunnanensis]MDC9590862.1 DUF3320 domain-containing protein [Xenorhabdus yunnanensis]
MKITLEGSIANKIGFVSHQNAVPILRELRVNYIRENIRENEETEENEEESIEGKDYKNLTLSLTSSPSFLEPKTWNIDQLSPDTSIEITERDIKLNAEYLFSLSESVKGDITLMLSEGENVLETRHYPIELLAKNQWGGGTMPELIAAFVMPNDAAIDKVLKGTSDVLRRAGKNDGINGYNAQSRRRCWELVSALWSAVAGLKLSYALPPASFDTQGQKIRTPSTILDGKIATCLDSTLLFAAAIEQMGMNPLVVFTEGHAFVGFWLQPQEFSTLITEDVSSVRKRIDLQEMVVFETTMITKFPAPSFSQAIETAKRQLTEQEFIMAVDIHRARMQKIRPLALATQNLAETLPQDIEAEVINDALEEAPVLPGFDVDIQTDLPNSVADKLTVWQRKLLDLTTRNRLLHLPENAKGVRLICPNPAELEDKLAEGKTIRIVAMPDLEMAGRDAELYQQQHSEDLYEEYARGALKRGEVVGALEKIKLEVSLIDLYRKARNDLDEGGANTLFLAIGFLKWKKSVDDPKTYSAPLILLPIRLERKSVLSGVTMRIIEEEPRFNLTLLELLRHDFQLTIPDLEGELPTDGSGIDVEGIWNTVRRAVRDISGFEVTKELVIGTFSFSKYLMWKDLADRSEQLMQHSLVKYLIERQTDKAKLELSGEFIKAEELDNNIKASDVFIPLPADSSQLSAIVASASGRDFVLDGPPGTGKSQTIANMIAHNLALGRRVLFVAEKKAALDVVYRRLAEKGLGEFCIELHSSKTSKVEFLKQLERAWDTRDVLSKEEWEKEARHVQRLREKLNNTVDVLHKKWPNDLTVHQAIGRVIRDANDATPKLQWPAGTLHDQNAMTQLRDVARRLDLNAQSAKQLSGVFDAILRIDWSNGWQESIVATAGDLPNTLGRLIVAVDELLTATSLVINGNINETSIHHLHQLIRLTELLLAAYGCDLRFMFAPNISEKVNTARKAIALVEVYRETQQTLSIAYSVESYRRINIEQFERDWQKAEKKFWFLSSLAKKKVSRDLASQGGASGNPNVLGDLAKLRKLRECLTDIEGCTPEIQDIPGWNAQNSDLKKMAAMVDLSEQIRAAMSTIATSSQHFAQLRTAIATLVIDSNELLNQDGNLAIRLVNLKQAMTDFQHTAERLGEQSGELKLHEQDLSHIRALAANITQHKAELKSWCDWCRVREEANAIGLQPMTEALAKNALSKNGLPKNELPEGQLTEIFETAYARWFAAWIIDAEPLLHNFVPAEHMSDIEAYRKQDDRLSELAVRYIRAKLCGLIPAKNEVSKQSGFGILKHELQKSRRHKPVRQLAQEMGDAMSKLSPCMLMSPLSIAQFLPANQELFDLVIFDEASQISPWDAVGSIARGKQVVIAGDPRQMPPTSFFNRGTADQEDDTEQDMESILDECLAAGLYNHSLSWHYRSRHESLIAFSNHRYYDSNLITFPAAQTTPSTVKWHRIDSIYTKGKNKRNQKEAEAIVAETVKRLTDPAFINTGQSIGIITLNSEQQSLISDLLDKARQQYPAIEPYFQDDLHEPVVVKNLETVQGDERDVIMLGIGYGPTEPEANTMSMNFGPLNREGGWRRLNVAITRARHEMLLFTSFDSSMIDLNRTNARAVRDLKHFIEFAKRGPIALAQAIKGSLGSYDSPFEEAVAQGLRQKGWHVVPQIGVSRFRIDLGIVHPDRSGDYLVGVECDGATYHSAATARDRDKVRSAILKGLGWELVRVWSTEWWVDKHGALERLHNAIEALLAESRAQAERIYLADSTVKTTPTVTENTTENTFLQDAIVQGEEIPESLSSGKTEIKEAGVITDINGTQNDFIFSEKRIARNYAAERDNSDNVRNSHVRHIEPIEIEHQIREYKLTDFSGFVSSINPDKFYHSEYNATLRQLIVHALEQEAPLLDTLLVQRIARAHGFGRAGQKIRNRILEIVASNHFIKADKIDGDFVWLSQKQSEEWYQVRLPATEDDIRSMSEIAYEEIRPLAALSKEEDRVVEIARMFGFKRVTGIARARIEAVINDITQ